MKRRKFVFLTLAAYPFVALGKFRSRNMRDDKGFKVGVGEGRYHGHIQLKGVNSNILDVKVSGKDTDGDIAVFEQTSVSQGRGTPLHLHFEQDEIFYVLEGEYLFQSGDQKHLLKAGDTIFLPRMVPHAWTQASESGKMAVILQPAGKLEEFFLTLAEMEKDPTPEEMAKVFEDNGMKIVGPPLKLE